MPMKTGRYDDICEYAAKQAGINNETGGGVLLIVIGGNKGNGFSAKVDLMTTLQIPGILENVADEIRKNSMTDILKQLAQKLEN